MRTPASTLTSAGQRSTGAVRQRRRSPRRFGLAAACLALLAVGPAGAVLAQSATTPRAAPPTATGSGPRASLQGPAATAFLRMLEAERTLEVVGTTVERIDLPGVQPDPHHQRFMLPVAASPELVARAFRLGLGASTEVAGRAVEVLELHGVGPLTPDWTFWVDRQTGLRLAYRVTDSAGGLVAEGRYSQVRAVRPRAVPRPLPAPSARLEAQRLRRLIDPANVPQGYVPIGLARTEIGSGKIPALRITFFDGLDALVLLVYRRQAPLPAGAGVRLASRQVGRFTLSAVGPAPEAALQAWLDHLSRGPLARVGPARTLEELGAP